MIADTLPQPGPVREWHGVDRQVFEGVIAPAAQPAVLRGLAAGWPAVRAGPTPAGTAAYLGGFDSGRAIETFVGDPAIGGRFFYRDDLKGFNFARHQVPLGATLGELLRLADRADAPAIYAGAASAPDYLPGFADANPMPLLPASVAPRVWVGNAVTVSAHYDLSANIACVAAGRRRFTLFPPDQVGNLYVGPLDHTMAGQPASMVDIDRPDLDRFPRFRDAAAAALVADLAPGDAIYIPTLWWHQVRSYGPLNLLVNYWWGQPGDGSPFEVLVHGLLALRDLPAAERAGWRAMFDHYLFGEDAPAAADHLPVHARGILGPPSPARSRMLRHFLLGALNKG